ncbi:DUF1552 domain-containing protein [Fimbriiglobus ruber]|uniref:Tat (Twin-arginine translocation) pathway signal sequence domain protein n=1 Tax=Fimbriiglobus ruber TaxID=1908690 RepID=A0A225DH57_9BACT|nr:DUF1552 domain-containing protein [Fimbriiglobus ruber]OWK40323.1 hypothetical protein FRUB_05242 [Fimbriiglobus ruber]
MTATNTISRRAVLKGLGVTVALPWLESLAARAGTPAAKAAPKRLACLFIGDGISPPHWWAKGSGANMELGSSLTPLAPFKEKINVIDGLWNKEGDGGHAKCTGNILSGASLHRGRTIKGGLSMDQLLAKHYEEETAQPSLVLGCEQPVSGFHESQYSMVYASHISWRNADSPVPIELYPALAFDSLFGGKAGKLQGSILDDVLGQANDLSGKVSGTDKLKLDEYLSSVRETEQRVQRLNKMAKDDAPAAPAAQRPSTAQPKDLREYSKLMCDVIALAFQSDRSRVATLLMSRDLSGQVYPFLGIRDDHHSYSHSNEGPEYQSIVKFYVEQYAYLLDRLSKMPEGDGSVLDNSCIMFVSEHWNAHNGTRVPLVLAGGLGGTLRTGRTLDYLKAGNDKRKLCGLYLTLMDRMGLKTSEFGDAKERLAGI